MKERLNSARYGDDMIEADRIKILKDRAPHDDGKYVLYWMQQSQRAASNPALEYAAQAANRLKLPLLVGFVLIPDYPEASERHFGFLLEGLGETARALASRGIRVVARVGTPPDAISRLSVDAAMVVCDRGYLRHQRNWRTELADEVDKRIVQVEGDVVVPVETASDRREWAARTIRKKINSRRSDFLAQPAETRLKKSSIGLAVRGDLDLSRGVELQQDLDVDRRVPRVSRFVGGTEQARKLLTRFLRIDLAQYAHARNDPSSPQASQLSPYLHFGQISPVEIALKVQRAKSGRTEDKEAFLEELIVRRELAANFVYYTSDYDRFSSLPDWARKSLDKHKDDPRPNRYTRTQLEQAETHDPYWNAAMGEMRKTGYMHNYMRMYWGKKILEWCNTPAYAYRTTLYLNNKYLLDGRDPNSYTNVGWVFGLHDRPWTERPVFGQVRYMNAAGLERKFDIDKYVRWVDSIQ